MLHQHFRYTETLYAIIFLSFGNITLGANNNDENLNFLLFKEGGRGVFSAIAPKKIFYKI